MIRFALFNIVEILMMILQMMDQSHFIKQTLVKLIKMEQQLL